MRKADQLQSRKLARARTRKRLKVLKPWSRPAAKHLESRQTRALAGMLALQLIMEPRLLGRRA
ncbi:hypothetical protein D5400_11670 [Georhizobium profundi]|uniref:Uncharacterized protein n=1 Tax=Georhizobium profundi TaxID=2341112 RepID=A0A3Q8XR17_9HYPH|nr:hypothetical protein D5400_11670 [Georhizobium profundi]